MDLRWCGRVQGVGRGGIEAVEDEKVGARGRPWPGRRRRGGGDTGGESVHLVVVDLVPGDVPAGLVGADADSEVHGAEVVADGGQAGHEGEVGAADGEDQGVVGVVGGDDVVDLRGGAGEGVLGRADVVEGLMGVGDDDGGQSSDGEARSEMVQRGDDALVRQMLSKTMATSKVRGTAMTR